MKQRHFIASLLFPVLLSSTFAVNSAPKQCRHHDDALEQNEDLRKIANIPLSWKLKDIDNEYNEQSLIHFKILGFNDFHGQLSTGRTVGGRPVGSAPVLAAYLKAAQEKSDNTAIIVHAGDHVGATPPVSALLKDEPSITFLNLLANDHCNSDDDDHSHKEILRHKRLNVAEQKCNIVGTLGNHEFDEGKSEMLRLINGGNHATGPFLEEEYKGAYFSYVSANVIDDTTGKPLLKPYVIKRIKGMPVAFIGAVLKETPSIVTPTGVAGLSFVDEADAINAYVPELKKMGVRSIVVTIHQGTRQSFYGGPTLSEQSSLDGSIANIVYRLDNEIDIVISGHAHSFTNALIPNQNGKEILIVQAFSRGTAYDDIDVAIDPRSKDIVSKSARIVTTYADVEPGLTLDEDIIELVTQAETAVEPLINQIIGTTNNNISRIANDAGESPLGNLIADAQRSKTGTDFSFMNTGGIRSDVPSGNVTWGDLFTIQPFANNLVTMQLSGEQIIRLLNQQWDGQPFPRILKVSGLVYTWDNALPLGNRIVEVHKADGSPLQMTTLYSVTVNSFIAAGGDNYTVLTEGKNPVTGANDLDALIEYISALPQPFNAVIESRINRLN